MWNAAISSEEFVFKSIEDILEENTELKSQLEYFKGVLDGNITEILNSLQTHQSDINDLRIQQGHTSDEVVENGENIARKVFSTFNFSQTCLQLNIIITYLTNCLYKLIRHVKLAAACGPIACPMRPSSIFLLSCNRLKLSFI